MRLDLLFELLTTSMDSITFLDLKVWKKLETNNIFSKSEEINYDFVKTKNLRMNSQKIDFISPKNFHRINNQDIPIVKWII